MLVYERVRLTIYLTGSGDERDLALRRVEEQMGLHIIGEPTERTSAALPSGERLPEPRKVLDVEGWRQVKVK